MIISTNVCTLARKWEIWRCWWNSTTMTMLSMMTNKMKRLMISKMLLMISLTMMRWPWFWRCCEDGDHDDHNDVTAMMTMMLKKIIVTITVIILTIMMMLLMMMMKTSILIMRWERVDEDEENDVNGNDDDNDESVDTKDESEDLHVWRMSRWRLLFERQLPKQTTLRCCTEGIPFPICCTFKHVHLQLAHS